MKNKPKQSTLIKCIPRLVELLGTKFEHANLEASERRDITIDSITDLRQYFAELGISSEETNMRSDQITVSMLPMVFTNSRFTSIVQNIIEDKVSIYRAETESTEVIPIKSLGFGKCVLFYSKNTALDNSLESESKNWFWKLLLRFKQPIIYASACSFIITILNIIAPLIVMGLFSRISAGSTSEKVVILASGLFIYVFALMGFFGLRSFCTGYVSAKIGKYINNQVMRRILMLPPSYTEVASIGSQMIRFRDFMNIQHFFSSHSVIVLLELPFIPLILGVIFYISNEIGFVVMIGIAASIILAYCFQIWSTFVLKESAAANKDRHDFVISTLSTVQTVKMFGLQKVWLQKYRSKLSTGIIGSYKMAVFDSIINTSSHLLVSLTGLFALFYGVQRVIADQITPGELMAVMLLVWRVMVPIKMGFSLASQLGRVKQSIRQLNSLMGLKIEHRSNLQSFNEDEVEGFIEFRKVSLKYSKDAHPALLGISFKVEPGETLVIYGNTSSGKTSLLKLLLKMYKPQGGQVLIDHLNIQQINTFHLRQMIAYLPQNRHHLSGTLMDNLKFINPKLCDDDLEIALGETGLESEIEHLPKGLNTDLGDPMLSETFRRRFAIAMMFAKGKKIWAVDRPELTLENMHERQLIATLEAGKGMATIIIATQNSEYLNIADKVLWLDHGRSRFFGSKEELDQMLKREAA